MKRKKIILSVALSVTVICSVYGQESKYGTTFPDSVTISVHESYNKVNGFHRWIFGENYRKEWSISVRLPLINVNQIRGGLSPEKFGGGMETKSIRMIDKTGKEWVIRSVEKVPDKIVPENLRGTFVLDWVGDEYSAQHPYSALCVPPLADAVGVPHANPVIGVLVADTALSTFGKGYAGRVVLLEEREPSGPSENTIKVLNELVANNETSIDKTEFLKARMLDLLIGDWDRHEDQWRWTVEKDGKKRIYTAVPRDRDQVMHLTQGVIPSIASAEWLDPILDNFDGQIPRVRYSLFKTRFIQQYPSFQFSYEEWMRVTNQFVKSETDEVLDAAVKRLPKAIYKLRHDELLAKLKKRRDNIPEAMSEYYHFINRIVDIRASDMDEKVSISDDKAGGLRIMIQRKNKSGEVKETLMNTVYDPEITKEIRLYVSGGNDEVTIDNKTSPIKLRLVGSTGEKSYTVTNTLKTIQLYGRKDSVKISGETDRLTVHLKNDTINTHFVVTNPYNVWMPMATGSINRDDGFLLGLGFRYTAKDGFRKLPYSSIQELMVTHSFETNAFRLNYDGQWIQSVGKADIALSVIIDAPDNTMNFFGQGNETALNKIGDYHKYYRTRFDYYQFEPSLQWHTGKNSAFSAGPSLQYYHFDVNGNVGRSVMQPGLIKSYDSTSYAADKVHLGLVTKFISNTEDSKILPTKGYYLNLKLQYYDGLNDNSKSYAQLIPEFMYFQKIDTGACLVFSDRVGGGVTIGNPAFYQSLFLGGQGNLLGYFQNRFSGKQMVYNNLQGRLRLANLGGYILPGQLGLTGFYDIGRVWIDNEHSDTWHQGVGGGLYFAPASLTVIQVMGGHSSEGWYPFVAFNFRL
ncbi:BamA/TamA family outer membrane protein [Mucilaginibacter sp. E4BP6]|uniref:BamA/TamA family outer membrane protein n=1 Tax=Mucilaginibacter sp. E4BP6 TaxID=2723089 RepID=UPI0015CA8820|nr:BamA/TamA family outer membrane protein [Mucilaginibacter sp. E4BP6]NYE65501.1 hypothetical protein [Mucilaginibacter sp. E4BP6]